MAESFFRNDACLDRISVDGARAIVSKGLSGQQVYIVGSFCNDTVAADTVIPAHKPVSTICVDWKVVLRSGDQSVVASHADIYNLSPDVAAFRDSVNQPITLIVEGHFGQVAVLPALCRRGLGATLLTQAEQLIVNLAKGYEAALLKHGMNVSVECTLGMHVLNVRTDVLQWYPKFGYKIVSSDLPFDAPEILNEEYSGDKVKVNILQKSIPYPCDQ
jgi:GNAT superfamily N-acetyltransferase